MTEAKVGAQCDESMQMFAERRSQPKIYLCPIRYFTGFIPEKSKNRTSVQWMKAQGSIISEDTTTPIAIYALLS